MPLRIMYWNIQSFGINKFQTSWWDRTASRGLFIFDTIAEQDPDVLAVVEVRTNAVAGFGGVISDTSGGPAVQALLWQLRGFQPAANWSVVPPLILSPGGGYSEGIAVFFKAARLTFEGPMLWNGAGAVAPGGAGAAYAGAWQGALPNTNSTILVQPQDTLAGQLQFFAPMGGAAVNFPNANSRKIWFTQFTDQTNHRILSLFSLHLPADRTQSRQGFAALAQVPEIANAVAANEDRVVIGDFNINLNDPLQRDVFQHLTGGPAVLPAYPVAAQAYATQFTNAGGALATMLKAPANASTNYGPPYYDYGGHDAWYGTLLGLDNAFVARGGGAAAANNQVVVNRVVGTGGSLAMVQTIPAIIAAVAPGGARARRFRTCVNYGSIGAAPGASDHMPLRLELP